MGRRRPDVRPGPTVDRLLRIAAEAPELYEEDGVGTVLATASLRDFVEQAWQIVVPESFQSNYHIDAVCEHLQALFLLQIRDLLITVPSQEHSKVAGIRNQDAEGVAARCRKVVSRFLLSRPSNWLTR